MARDSVSKIVANAGKTGVKVAQTATKGAVKIAESGTAAASKVAKGTVDVANKTVKVAAKGAKGAVDMVAKVANTGVDVVTKPIDSTGKAITNTGKGIDKVLKKVGNLCNPDSIIPCVTVITLIAYMVIVSPSTVLNIFATPLGKSLTLVVVAIALMFDVKIGVLLGLAAVLSISLASVKQDISENFHNPVELTADFGEGNAKYILDASENEVDPSGNDVEDVVETFVAPVKTAVPQKLSAPIGFAGFSPLGGAPVPQQQS
tara:strand:- start:20545 stop:21327 length:783 start_codon:yes stop_codon:yes gene_type:complete